MADQEGREPIRTAVEGSTGAPATRPSLPRRIWKWFNAQGLVAKFVVSIVTAVATALAVGVVTRTVFVDGGSGSATTTTLAPDAAPFSASTRIRYVAPWSVWLQEPLPDPRLWPGPATHDDELVRFLAGLGAIDNETWLRIVLDGTAGRTSTITGARAVVVERRDPSAVAQFKRTSEGEEDTIGWYFDLDEPESPAHELLKGYMTERRGPTYFANRTITVAPGEALTIDVIAVTEKCDCRWVIDLDVVVEGTPRTVRIDNDGEPFRTSSGQPDAPLYLWTNPDDPGIYLDDPDGGLVRLSP